MTIADLIVLVQNKLSAVGHLKTSAVAAGDIEQLAQLEVEEATILTLIAQLKQLQGNN